MCKHKIEILYTKVGSELSSEKWGYHVKKLPLIVQKKIKRYIKWQDRQASLFGKLLLMEGIMKYGYPPYSINNISFDKNGRPFLDNKIDFSISHSHEYVACAIAYGAKVGLDIERITKHIDLFDYKYFIGEAKFNIIKDAQEPNRKFYELWTKDESVVKADGEGLSIPFSNIFIRGNTALLSGTTWYLKKIPIDSYYFCHLATNIGETELLLRKIYFNSDEI